MPVIPRARSLSRAPLSPQGPRCFSGFSDLVRRRFRPPLPATALAGDITCLRTGRGRLYPAVVIDLATRMVVGRSMPERMTAALAVSALEMARSRGYVAGGATSRSDRGSQHASRALADRAAANDVGLSAGRTGSCHDNAVAESFFAALKNEMHSLGSWATRDEARRAVFEYIEGCYNRQRPHSTIGYQIPAERMDAFMGRIEAALAGDGETGGEVPLAA